MNSADRGTIEDQVRPADLPPRADGAQRLRPGRVGQFMRRYGWRAYALPVLAVITVLVLITLAGQSAVRPGPAPSGPAPATPPTAQGSQSIKSDDPGADALNTQLASDALPAGGSYTAQGTGTYAVIPGTSPVVGSGAAVRRYDIEAEGGITGIDLTGFAAEVQQVLSDPRSWAGHGVALQRVDSGSVDFHVTLTSSITVRGLCGYDIPVETSCYAAAGSVAGLDVNRVVLNDSRWVRGDPAYVGDLNSYRIYMINHEDGHALGHLHAHACLADGLAPAMMQQTIGLKSTTGQMCQANPWPFPPGATDAPGAEAPDTPVNNQFNLQNQ